jgi:hypothetical protein
VPLVDFVPVAPVLHDQVPAIVQIAPPNRPGHQGQVGALLMELDDILSSSDDMIAEPQQPADH